MQSTKRIRVGLLGAGKSARWHLRAYRHLPGVDVVAIANPTTDRGLALKRRYGIRRHYASGMELIEQADVDAVDVCIPAAAHSAHVEAALSRGLHVYCEKPLVVTEAQYVSLCNKASGNKPVLFNGFNYRFLPGFMRTRELLANGAVGTLRFLRVSRMLKEKLDSDLLTAAGVGMFHECHCHFADALDYFDCGVPTRLRVMATTVLPWSLSPDTATTHIQFAGGLLVELSLTMASPGLAPEILAFGTAGTLRMQFGAVRVTPQRDDWSLPALIRMMCMDAVRSPHRVLRNPFYGSCRHFIECIRRGQTSPCDAVRAYRAFRITEAIVRSHQAGGADVVPVLGDDTKAP